jgi:23S rRNA pseudouridine2457 synthase
MPSQSSPSRDHRAGGRHVTLSQMPVRTFLFYKPYGVVSQFTPTGGHESLAAFGPFPGDVYPVGRLDWDSEGLLILTNDNGLKHRLTDPRFRHPRTYLVQVERIPADRALSLLRKGVILEGKRTLPADVRLLPTAPDLPARPVPIRARKNVPTAWIEITLWEGRNRQVRKMTAAVGHPTLRLIRISMGEFTLAPLQPGESTLVPSGDATASAWKRKGARKDWQRRPKRPGRRAN